MLQESNPTSQAVVLRSESVNVEQLIARAIDKGVPVETMERLMVIRRELKAEAAKTAFDQALADFQSECPTIVKAKVVNERDSNKVRYRYAPLEVIVTQVKEILQRHGFSYTLDAQVEPGWVTATCKATHCLGHAETSTFKVPIEPKAFMNEAQKFASALTFAKRYSFCNAFGILTGDEDDDSQASGEPKIPQRPPPTTQAQPSKPPPVAKGDVKVPEKPPETAEHRKTRWLEECVKAGGGRGDYAEELFQELGVLLPTEHLVDFPETKVPATRKTADMLLAQIRQKAGVGEPPPEADKPDEVWKSFPVPFGKHAGKSLGDLETKTVYGFWLNFKVETEYQGKPRDPARIESDRAFRAALDAAGVHYQFTEPTEEVTP